jgi:predicted 2-oxoglutarate/Fe(II)-dependent dioxygenase YbiX
MTAVISLPIHRVCEDKRCTAMTVVWRLGLTFPTRFASSGVVFAGAILYLNDEFDGGDLRYFQGPQFKPVPGLLIVHNGEAVHGVTPITGGTRYTIGAFYIA